MSHVLRRKRRKNNILTFSMTQAIHNNENVCLKPFVLFFSFVLRFECFISLLSHALHHGNALKRDQRIFHACGLFGLLDYYKKREIRCSLIMWNSDGRVECRDRERVRSIIFTCNQFVIVAEREYNSFTGVCTVHCPLYPQNMKIPLLLFTIKMWNIRCFKNGKNIQNVHKMQGHFSML